MRAQKGSLKSGQTKALFVKDTQAGIMVECEHCEELKIIRNDELIEHCNHCYKELMYPEGACW